MSRLVVFAGTHAAGWPEVHRLLEDTAPALTAARLVVSGAAVRGAGTNNWRRFADSEDDGSIAAACREALSSGADTFLTGSEELEDPMRDPAQVAHLAALAAEVDMELTVLLIVRDQLDYLNALYCERVVQLATAKDFDAFVADPQPSERFDYENAFRALVASPSVRLLALPYLADPQDQGRAVLSALDLAVESAADTAAGAAGPDETGPTTQTPTTIQTAPTSRASTPGPYTIAALRLLHKRFRRNGFMHRLGHRRLVGTAQQLLDDARLGGWDDRPFWGWSPATRAEAIERFEPGNDAFAQAVWARPWGDDWTDGRHTDVDLASSDPETVVALLSAVDQYVTELREPAADSGEVHSGD